jgi:hypothetical protein
MKLSNFQARSARQPKVALEEHSDSCTDEINDPSMSDITEKAYMVADILDDDLRIYKKVLGHLKAVQWQKAM